MNWMQSFEGENPDLEKAIRTPIGAMSPLWLAFAGAAAVGVTYWWMTRWARPLHVEAGESAAPALSLAVEEAAATYELSPAAIEDVVDTPASESLDEMFEAGEAAYHAIGDDLTQLIGVGPKLAVALADRGVTRFQQIAAWGEDDLAFFDRELNLRGRALREGWVDQARALSGETGAPIH